MNNLSIKELMYVFKQIEDKSKLLILREVCEKWNHAISLLLKKIKLWESMCSTNAISPWVYEILEKKYPSNSLLSYDKKTFDQSIWKEIFLFYKQWRLCASISSIHLYFDIDSKSSTDYFDEKATCLDIWGDYVAVGNNIGNVHFYLIRGHYKKLYHINVLKLFITEVKLWFNNAQKLIAVIAVKNQYLKFWDIEKQEYIANPSENQSSTIIECKFHRLFVANNLEIVEYKYHKNKIYERQRIVLSSMLSSSIEEHLNIVGLYISQKKLTIIGCNLPTIVTTSLDIPVLPRRSPVAFNEDYSVFTTKQFSNNTYVLCHIPMSDLLIIIDDLFLYTAIKNPSNQEYEWKAYQLRDPLKQNVSSVTLFANTLIIGTRTGSLNLYVLKNIYHFRNLNLEAIPSRSFYLSTKPITDIKIIDSRGIFHIFALSGSTIHIVRFPESDFEQPDE